VGYGQWCNKTHRLWKLDTKVIVKARDVNIFEDTDHQDELSKETVYVPYLNIDDIETKDNHESSKMMEKRLMKATLKVAVPMKK